MTRTGGDAPSNSRQQRTVLLAADHKNSVFAEIVAGNSNRLAYSAYGHQTAQQDVMTRIGFNGELREAKEGWYFLGNGYRVYNPVLMRFHSPDSWSPFGAGGLNAYVYCGGEPVNASDSTGHIKFPTFSFSRRSPSPPPLELPRTAATPNIYVTAPVASSSQTPLANIQQRPLPAIPNERSPSHRPSNSTTTGSVNLPPPPPGQFMPRPSALSGRGANVSTFNPLPVQPQTSTPEIAPVPHTRTLRNGTTRHYFVRYDNDGNPTQSSVERMTMSQIRNALTPPNP